LAFTVLEAAGHPQGQTLAELEATAVEALEADQ
jgi:hypothetical protein